MEPASAATTASVAATAAPAALAPYIAAKGSITVDGVSLTVNSHADQSDGSVHFGLNIIPHTWEMTTLGDLQPGDPVNLEIDVLARYLREVEGIDAEPLETLFEGEAD